MNGTLLIRGRGRGRGSSQSTRGGPTTSNQRSITNYVTPKQNIPVTVVKRKRSDNVIHRQGNPHPSIRAAANGVTQSRAGPSKQIDDVVADNNKKLESNGSKLDALLQAFNNFNGRVDDVEARVNLNTENIADAGQRLNVLEQKSLNNQMEISGIDASNVQYSGLRIEVINFITSLGIDINPEHIVDVYKFNRSVRGSPRSIIIVTFIHETIKRRVITEKIKLDRANGNCQVYFSEVLTRTNRQILMAARQLRKQRLIFSTWTVSGEVFIKTHEGSEKIRIYNTEQLDDFKPQADYNSDESTYETVIQNRHSNPKTAHHQPPLATQKNTATYPLTFSPKISHEPRKKNFQRETSGIAQESLNGASTSSTTRPATQATPSSSPVKTTANTKLKNTTANNNSTNLSANNPSISTANNPSINTANNQSINTANNQTPAHSVNQQAQINNFSSSNSLMLYDTPVTQTQGAELDDEDLLDFSLSADLEGDQL